MEELTGGTFSISNGGVFGSMLSTPIINPPQSAILGIHATKERAVVESGQIVIRPMNYFALSYDHRIIDGREAVLSLVAMKDALEDRCASAGSLIVAARARGKAVPFACAPTALEAISELPEWPLT